MSQIDLIAIIYPKPGKTDRVGWLSLRISKPSTHETQVVELLQEMAVYVKENEPDVLRYSINVETKKSGETEVIMLETWVLTDVEGQQMEGS